MSSNQIPGVPDGWEVDHVSRFGEIGEYCVNPEGEPHLINGRTVYRVCIIRKVQKPARYRPFRDAEEYLPHWGKPIRTKGSPGFDSIVSMSGASVYVAIADDNERYTMQEAFKQLEFADGTPFGFKINE